MSNPNIAEAGKATQYKPGHPGTGGRPKGSSILAPILRKLAQAPNEHDEGALAVAIADDLLAGSRALAQGVNPDIKIDLNPLFKLLDRTDPEIKQGHLTISEEDMDMGF